MTIRRIEWHSMLIIGHRGSAATHADNTIAGIREAIACSADMVEFDVRLTRDKVPVLSHSFHMYHTHRRLDFIARHTISELQKRTAGSDHPIVTLEQALKECHNKIFVIVEIKELRAAQPSVLVISKIYSKRKDWEHVLVSSFNPLVLRSFKKQVPHVQLGMLHYLNPLGFIAWQRQLNLTAVGFHRLHINKFVLEVAKQLDLMTYAYTVNRPDAAKRLFERGIDAIVTDTPRAMIQKFKK